MIVLYSFGYPESTTALHGEDGASSNDHAGSSIVQALPRPFSKDVPSRPEPVPFDSAPFSASNPHCAPGTLGTGGLSKVPDPGRITGYFLDKCPRAAQPGIPMRGGLQGGARAMKLPGPARPVVAPHGWGGALSQNGVGRRPVDG